MRTKRALIISVALAIIALALIIRLWHITIFPAGLHNDEMSCGLDARLFLAEDKPSIFKSGWLGHPNLGFFIISIFLRIFGDNLFGLRMGAVIAGTLSLVGMFFLTRELFSTKAALFATAFASAFHLHVHFSRTGFHNIYAAAFTVWSLVFFVRSIRGRKLRYALLSGFCAGIGLQTYNAALLTPALVLLYGLFFFTNEGKNQSDRKLTVTLSLLCFGLFAALSASPLLIRAFVNLHDASPRTFGVFVFSPSNEMHVRSAVGAGGFLDIVIYQLKSTLEFFFWGKDTSVQYGYTYSLFDPFGLVLFWGGIIVSLLKKNRPNGLFLICCILITVIAGSVLTIDPPFAPRLVTLSILLPIFPGLFLASASDRLLQYSSKAVIYFGHFCLIGIIFGSVIINVNEYFVHYAKERPGELHDIVSREIQNPSQSLLMLDLLPTPHNFEHEAYKFMAPGLGSRRLSSLAEVAQIISKPHPNQRIMLLSDADPCVNLPDIHCNSRLVQERPRIFLSELKSR